VEERVRLERRPEGTPDLPSGGGGDPLVEIVARHAVEGCVDSSDFVRFHRISRPRVFRKTHTRGPTLTVVAQGRKVARFGRHELSYDPSLAFIAIEEMTYDTEVVGATPEHPYLAASFEIPVDVVVKTLLALPEGDAAGRDSVPALVVQFDEAMKATVTRLFRAVEDPLERRIVAPLVLEELVYRLLRSDAAAAVRGVVRARDAHAIHTAMRYIRTHASRALSVDEIARHVAMSPSHFAHRFRAVAGASPIRYLKNVRLDEAKAVMRTGELRVREIAARVGYESASHFTRDFKAAFGVTPAAYVRRVRSS
jgi:AraC-like DNA-binding protein